MGPNLHIVVATGSGLLVKDMVKRTIFFPELHHLWSLQRVETSFSAYKVKKLQTQNLKDGCPG